MHLLRKKPYTVTLNGKEGLKVVLSPMSGLSPQDKVYQYLNKDGTILIVPEKLKKEDL